MKNIINNTFCVLNILIEIDIDVKHHIDLFNYKVYSYYFQFDYRS